MGDTLTEISKKIRSSIYWLTLILALLLLELIPGVDFQSNNEANTVEVSIKRDVLLTSTKSTLEHLESKWKCDCSYFDINRNKDIEEKTITPTSIDTACLDLMSQIINEKKNLLGSAIPLEVGNGKSIPFFDLKFITTLYPIAFKGLIFYFLLSLLFSSIELKRLLNFNNDKLGKAEITNRLSIENEINYPSLYFLATKGLLIIAGLISLILFFKVFSESQNYFCSYAEPPLKTVKIYLGILNIALLIAIFLALFLTSKKSFNLKLTDKKK